MSEELKNYINYFINDNSNKDLELEVRFGTIGKKHSIIEFNNVIEYLKSKNFKLETTTHSLRIQSEFLDPKIGRNRISNLRCEIYGSQPIKDYCNTETLQDSNSKIKDNIIFNQKIFVKNDDNGMIMKPINVNEFNFRVSMMEEKIQNERSGIVKQLLSEWNDKKKIYRMIDRYSFSNFDEFPGLRVDLSIVRSSNKNKKNNLIPSYNMVESNVLLNPTEYEIEIELDKKQIKSIYGFDMNPTELVNQQLKKLIKYILSGLQGSNFPIPYSERKNVQKYYYNLINNSDINEDEFKYLKTTDFIGPSSISLEQKHIQSLNLIDKSESETKTEESSSSYNKTYLNIRKNYSVTDKADGKRKLLYIMNNGNIYMIDTNMNIQFTGMKTKSKEHFNSIIDGEHILHDKQEKFINLFACFDIYFINKKDVREKLFYTNKEEDIIDNNYRYSLLQEFIKTLKPKPIINTEYPLRINVKKFEFSKTENDIFKCCNNIQQNIDDGLYEYETDGLIFTPLYLGVGCQDIDDKPKNKKHTWLYSFKWKPPQYNTIDFLATTQKTQNGNDIIKNIYEEGSDYGPSGTSIKSYKTLILRVGFDERKHGYINPCNDIIENKLPKFNPIDNNENYKPVPFYPHDPTDSKAYLCNIMIDEFDDSLYTEDKQEIILDNTIIECRYDKTKQEGWRWIPIRVRQDKTAELKSGIKNYGNAYHVAQSVWSSIHYPITKQMITTGLNIPEIIADDDVYYNRSGNTQTYALRDFHNLYVKRKLIQSVSRTGYKLIDLAVGKGGDFPKWIASKLGFVFGIDISKDNIENRLDGACARYLNYLKREQRIPKCLFVNGDSGKHILSGEAMFNEKGKQIINAIFGNGTKDEKKLGTGVFKNYGIVKDGFDIVSCQFAMHYFFKDHETLNTFIRNICETCKIGGHFIGTCYDGNKIFQLLREKKQNESIIEMKDDSKVWEITKIYDNDEFKDDITSVGYAIDVYQDTINKTFREYLVNFNYFTILMEKYGFDLIERTEARKMKLPSASDTFDTLFYKMKKEIASEKKLSKYSKTNTNIGKALDLEKETIQQKISFLNRYFIFRKNRNVNCENAYINNSTQIPSEIQIEKYITQNVQDVVIEQDKKDKKKKKITSEKSKKLKKKIKFIIDE